MNLPPKSIEFQSSGSIYDTDELFTTLTVAAVCGTVDEILIYLGITKKEYTKVTRLFFDEMSFDYHEYIADKAVVLYRRSKFFNPRKF